MSPNGHRENTSKSSFNNLETFLAAVRHSPVSTDELVAESEEPCRRVSKFYRRGNRIKPPEHMLTLWLRRCAPIVYPLRYPSSSLRYVA